MDVKNISILTIFILLSRLVGAQTPGWQWAKDIGAINNHSSGLSTDADAMGNIYTTGIFGGTADFDPGPGIFNLSTASTGSLFISKLDSLGNFVWAKAILGLRTTGTSIVLDDSSNICLSGTFSGTVDFDPDTGVFNLTSKSNTTDFFISKLDSAGHLIWAKVIGGNGGDFTRAITVNTDGDIYATGYFSDTCDFDPGSGSFNLASGAFVFNPFVCKLNKSGNFLWAKKIGSDADAGHSIALNASNGVYAIAGSYNSNSVVVKLDNTGNIMWSKNIIGGSSGYIRGKAIAVDASGNVITTGGFNGTVDFDAGASTFNLSSLSLNYEDVFVSKSDSMGNIIWVKQMGGNFGEAFGTAITTDASDNIYAAGTYGGTVDFDPSSSGIYSLTSRWSGSSSGSEEHWDIFVTKLTDAGTFAWTQEAGGASRDVIASVSFHDPGSINVTGNFYSSIISFDTINFATVGYSDICIAKLNNIITGIDEITKPNNISIYPNPASDKISFVSHILPGIQQIDIFDILGQQVHTYKPASRNLNQHTLNISDYPTGVYYVQVTLNGFTETKKLVIAR